jgi:subtilisin family serine protease
MVAKRRKDGKTSKTRSGTAKAPDGGSAKSAHDGVLPATDSSEPGFVPEVLDRTVIAIPLLKAFEREKGPFHVAIDLNLDYKEGLTKAREKVISEIETLTGGGEGPAASRAVIKNPGANKQYVFATLEAETIKTLVREDNDKDPSQRAIHHIWPDFPLKSLINKSISTVKGDAAHNAFSALGSGIVWAVVDSGIDAKHPHFRKHKNLDLRKPLDHQDFTGGRGGTTDVFGHGTHVAGIIAGQIAPNEAVIRATMRYRDENGLPAEMTRDLDSMMSGMAPRCTLLSLKVLDDQGKGRSSSIIEALQYIQEVNGDGRRPLVHGVNLSVGYDFDPEWFACGQSPLCTEVDRLVRSGVVVVVAAGNSGYGFVQSRHQGVTSAGLDLTINDPGNSDLAITVGSTHRDMPHTYGVSYFSSKGPTGDGRMKPDLLAPGEKILSCSSSQMSQPSGTGRVRRKGRKLIALYREDSGTSQAAPHVSGVIAAFLSIRREYLKQPGEVKRVFLSTATDLNRAPYFQGRGLVDVMRAIQSV